MLDPSEKGLLKLAPAPICLVVGILIGLATDKLGLWLCLGVAAGAVLTGLLSSRSSR